MSTIEQIDQLVEVANLAGIDVRYEYFGGTGGGLCQIAGKRILFMDLALSSTDQLEKVQEVLIEEGVILPPDALTYRRAS